ncbi:MAG: helix-turn-helix domain-containing protein [Bacteroidales bacterium]
MEKRLQQLIEREGVHPSKFAELIGVQRSSISHILSGRNKPSFDMISNILKKIPRVNPDWLLLGNGSMYRQVVQTSIFDTINEKMEPAANDQQDKVAKNPKPSENPLSEKSIERVLVFYNDKTFKEYIPE